MPTRQDLIFLMRRDLLRLGGIAAGGALVAHIMKPSEFLGLVYSTLRP